MSRGPEGKFLPVGLLGGMGPAATVLTMALIIAATQADDDGDHIPLFVDHNPQVPSRIKALIDGTGESVGPTLALMAKRLETMGAQALAMPCNTAHAYTDVIREAVSIPFISMIEATAIQLNGLMLPNRRIGMLASPAVQTANVYGPDFAAYGLTPVFTKQPATILEAIQRLKRNGQDPVAADLQKKVAQDLLDQNCDVLLIACTELSLIPHAVPAGAIVQDSLDFLIQEICAFAQGSCPPSLTMTS